MGIDPNRNDGRWIALKMIKCRRILPHWSKENFVNNARKLSELKHQMRRKVGSNINQQEVEKERRINARIKETWRRDELYWKQRSPVKWVTEGDRNTTFFHLTTSSRRRRNHICRLRGMDGRWITNETDIAREMSPKQNILVRYSAPTRPNQMVRF